MPGNQFFIWCRKHVMGNFFFSLLFLQVSYLQSCVLHYFVLVVVLVFLDVW